MGNRFSNDEAGQMTLEEQLLLLARMMWFIENLQTSPKWLGKDDVEQHIRWAAKHLADDIWQRVIAKDYGTNGDA